MPGMTLLPRHIDFHATGTLGGCVSPSHPEITGATFTSLVSGTFSCLAGSTTNTSTSTSAPVIARLSYLQPV